MAYTIEQRDNPPLVFVVFSSDFDIRRDLPPYLEAFKQMMDQQAAPVPVVVDMREYDVSFDDMMTGIGQLYRKQHPLNHPNITEVTWVTGSTILKKSADGLMRFGIFNKLRVVNTLEEAM